MRVDDLISGIVNRLLSLGMNYENEFNQQSNKQVEQHCHHLIIQMNALIKNMYAEILKLKPSAFESAIIKKGGFRKIQFFSTSKLTKLD